ncbi:unnamed protein product [Durusdinium trenchii]|uniref:Phospholipase B-like n=1 Tax=Durusdinium trenchii TaxID=1381693 RepID=A0ABP0S0Z1_9DINO
MPEVLTSRCYTLKCPNSKCHGYTCKPLFSTESSGTEAASLLTLKTVGLSSYCCGPAPIPAGFVLVCCMLGLFETQLLRIRRSVVIRWLRRVETGKDTPPPPSYLGYKSTRHGVVSLKTAASTQVSYLGQSRDGFVVAHGRTAELGADGWKTFDMTLA